ncbi:hypothetical protein GGS23DRAFT_564432 [Durotheca rogersii]|uniref:uncharacterized protein n=1 Tax=Durotheca rogersii TaxID=419775 RepID=UPI00222036F4|nr:uncharacterized protein GGS23DRAFT_564432 [Durotheca rogersii]KAI5864442.1 hypothetical protein GGS23DRAFT_564432 [Durotheca rogersii]
MSNAQNKSPGRPGLPDPAAEFLLKIWSSMFPGMDDEMVYDESTSEFINTQKAEAETARKATEDKRARFVDILNAWDGANDKWHMENTNKKKSSRDNLIAKVRADISAKHSWDEVFASLSNAEDSYENPKGIGKWRKWGRKAAEKSEVVKPLVDLIPGGDYTSVICGGLKFILEACSAARKSREDIRDLINSLPEEVQLASEYAELYRLEPAIQIETNKLYAAVLSAIEATMTHLMKDHRLEFLKPLFLQNAYAPLGPKIEEVREASKRLETVLQFCDRKRMVDMNHGVEGMRRDIATIKNLFLNMLRAQTKHASWLMLWLQWIQENENCEQPPRKEYISWPELVRLLLPRLSDIVEDVLLADKVSQNEVVEQVLRAGFSMDRDKLVRAGWLMSNKRIHRWFRSQHSRGLLVNGNSTLDRITPVSFFCAMLVKGMMAMGPIVVLSYFCGLNTPGADGEGGGIYGGTGLLKALIAQLVTQCKPGKLTCLGREEAEKIKRTAPDPSLRLLRSVFRKLIVAAEKPIFIIIDGINYYETSELGKDTRGAVGEITRLLENEGNRPLVKVLVTSANRSFEVDVCFDDNEKIRIPDEVSGEKMGFVDRQFDLDFGEDMSRLQRDARHQD